MSNPEARHSDYIVREYAAHNEHGFEIAPAAAPTVILARFPIVEPHSGPDMVARNAWLFISSLVEAAQRDDIHAEAWTHGQRTVSTVIKGNIWTPPTPKGPISARLYPEVPEAAPMVMAGHDAGRAACKLSWHILGDHVRDHTDLRCTDCNALYGRPAIAPNGSLRIPIHNITQESGKAEKDRAAEAAARHNDRQNAIRYGD